MTLYTFRNPHDLQSFMRDVLTRAGRTVTWILFVATVVSSTGCAIYHPQRGVFVSSNAKVLDLRFELGPAPFRQLQIAVAPMQTTRLEQVVSQTSIVGSAVVSTNHGYVFDDIDQKNLMRTLRSSIAAAGVQVDSPSTDLAAVNALISFERLDMTQSFLGTGCLIKATVEFSGPKGKRVDAIQVQETSGATVSQSKNKAIASFVHNFVAKASAYSRTKSLPVADGTSGKGPQAALR